MGSRSVEDDFLHSPSEDPTWRESYYFNFVDLESGLSGFSTIGLLPSQDKREMVFALFYGDQRHVYFAEPKVGSDALSDRHLSYELVEPFREWRIKFSDDSVTADLSWKQRFLAYHFEGGSGTSWSGHFEQSGIVTGSVILPGGQIRKLRGFGQRDKSWGPRDWYIEGWFALHSQFDSLSIGLRNDTVSGIGHLSGGISSDEGQTALSKLELSTQYAGEVPGIPTGALSRIYDANGKCYTLKSKLISPSSFARFQRPFPGGSTELFEGMAVHHCPELNESGTGLLEWLFTHKKG